MVTYQPQRGYSVTELPDQSIEQIYVVRSLLESETERLAVPLLVEFPGFSDGASFLLGRLHAYDFFRRVVEETITYGSVDELVGRTFGIREA